jgi:hypothetical protein
VESEVVLRTGARHSVEESGVGGFDLVFPTRNISKKVGVGFRVFGEDVARSEGEGFECAGGKK